MRSVTEAEFTAKLLQYCRLRGWHSAHFRPARLADGRWRTAVQGNGKGFPDLVLVRDKRLVVSEVKRAGRKPTKEQWVWLEKLAATGAEAYVWDTEDWGEIERVLE